MKEHGLAARLKILNGSDLRWVESFLYDYRRGEKKTRAEVHALVRKYFDIGG